LKSVLKDVGKLYIMAVPERVFCGVRETRRLKCNRAQKI